LSDLDQSHKILFTKTKSAQNLFPNIDVAKSMLQRLLVVAPVLRVKLMLQFCSTNQGPMP